MAFVGSKLALDDAEETVAYRSFEHVLRTDPVLSRVVKTWASWRGEPADLLAPCPALCPMLKLAVKPAGASWEAEALHREPIYVSIVAAVAGLDCDQLTNLWAAIRRAIFPRDPERDEFVQKKLRTGAKVKKPTIVAPAFELFASEKDAPPNMLVARGVVELLLDVHT